MALSAITAALIGGGISAASSTGTDIANLFYNKEEAQRQREFNAKEAEKNRMFQHKMRDTALISSVQQAKKLGISPSLLLGQGSTSLGGSQASASQAHHNLSGISNAVTGVLSMLEKQEQIDAMQEMNEDRLQTMKDINQSKIQAMIEMNEDKLEYLNTINKNPKYGSKRKYTKEQLDSLFDKLD